MGIGYITNPYRGRYAMPMGPGYQNLAANTAAVQSLMGGLQALQAGAQQAQQQRAQAALLEQLGSVEDRAGLVGVLGQQAAARQGSGGGLGGILNSFNPFGSYGGMTPLEQSLRGSMLGQVLEDPIQRQLRQERLTGARQSNQAGAFGLGRLGADADWQDKTRARQESQWSQADVDRRREQGWQDKQRGRISDIVWPREDTLFEQGQQDRTRQLGEHVEDRRHQLWQRGRAMKRQGVQEKLDDQQVAMNEQKLQAGKINLDIARQPARRDYKRLDALVKADSQLAEIEENLAAAEELTPREALQLERVRQQREAMQVQMGKSLGVEGRPITPGDMLGRYRMHDPGWGRSPRLEVNVGGGSEGDKWIKAGERYRQELDDLVAADAAAAGVDWLDQLGEEAYETAVSLRLDGDDWETIAGDHG